MSFRSMIQESFQSSPRRIPSEVALATVGNDRGRVGKMNVRAFRNWSEHSEFIRAAINIRKTQVAGAEWDIAPIDPDLPYDVGLMREIKDRLMLANPKDEEFGTFIEKVVEDIIVLDAGSIELERMVRREPLYLHSVNGGEIKVSTLWDGTDPNESRYFWYPDNFLRGEWKNDDFIYIMETPRTNSVVGLSKLETLKYAIDSELEGHAFNSRQVKNAAPDGLLHLGKGAKQDNVDAFRAFWQAEQGRGTLAITGGTELPGFIKFHDSNIDMQFMEWQLYLVHKIAAVMMMDISDLTFGADINRSTAEVKDNQTEDRGIRPLMGRIAGRLTRGYVQDEQFGGADNNLGFRWTKLNLKESLARAKINQLRLAGMPTASVNQARKENGDEPLGPEYDELMMVTPQGAFRVTDLPTVREFMDSKKPEPGQGGPDGPPKPDGPKPPQVPPTTGKDETLIEVVKQVLDFQRQPAPPAEVHIDEGAIQVNVSAPPPQASGDVTVMGVSERVASSESDFILDTLGRVIGKEERVILEKTPGQQALELAEAQQLELQVETMTEKLRKARERAADTGTRHVVRQTDFVIGEKGRIVGKKESERDADQ